MFSFHYMLLISMPHQSWSYWSRGLGQLHVQRYFETSQMSFTSKLGSLAVASFGLHWKSVAYHRQVLSPLMIMYGNLAAMRLTLIFVATVLVRAGGVVDPIKILLWSSCRFCLLFVILLGVCRTSQKFGEATSPRPACNGDVADSSVPPLTINRPTSRICLFYVLC